MAAQINASLMTETSHVYESRPQRETRRRSNLKNSAIRSPMVRRAERDQSRDLVRDALKPISRCVIRVYYDVCKAIETHEHAGDFKEL
jgi:hypothetical protein